MPTLSDIARACEVSPMTVSHVLNNKPGKVSARTRERVLRAVREMDYHPNAVARGLAGGRMNTIGIVYLHSHEPIHTSESFVQMLDGILDMATHTRQDTLMCTSYSWADGVKNVSPLLNRRCDGLILVVPTLQNPLIPVLVEHRVPTVLLCGKADASTPISWVDTDNREAAAQAVERIRERGHERIACLYSQDEERYGYAQERMDGWRLGHERLCLPLDPDLLISLDYGVESQLEALMRRDAAQRPTALFCVTDLLAFGVMTLLANLGYRVPEDVSVIGFDDVPTADRCNPRLTTVRQPLKAIGQRCVEVLLAQIEAGDASPQSVIVSTEWIERDSLGPPPGHVG